MDLTAREKFLLKGSIDGTISEVAGSLSKIPKEPDRVVQREMLNELLKLANKVESVKIKM